MKKKILFILILLFIILIIPIPNSLKDGGTVEYKAILYKVSKVKSFKSTEKDYGYIKGTRIEILGKKIYDNTEYIVTGEYKVIETGDIEFKKYIENEFKKIGLIETEKLDSFKIYKIVNHGYYKSNENIKYYEISFEYSCKEGFKGCIYKTKVSSDMPNTYYENNQGIIWATVKNNVVIEFSSGFVAYIDSDFKVLEEDVYSISIGG